MVKRLNIIILFMLILTSCSRQSWFGEEKKVNLTGERVSVLTHDARLTTNEIRNDVKIILPRPTSNTNWKQAGGISNHSMQHLKINNGTNLLWRKTFGEGSSDENYLLTEPVVYKGTVFTLDVNARVSAFDINTGKKIWSRRVASKTESEDLTSIKGAGLAISNNKLVVTTGFNDVIMIDVDRMGEVWRYSANAPFRSAPTIDNSKIFVQTITDELIAIDLETGKELWVHQSNAEDTVILGGASPAVDMGVVVAVFSNGEIKAFRTDTGILLWADALTSMANSRARAEINSVRARVVIDRGMVYAIGNNDLMVAISLRSGRRIWEKEIGGLNQPCLAGNYIYVLNNNNELVAMTANSGEVLWIRKMPKYSDIDAQRGLILWSGPILASDNLIITSSSGEVYFISPYTGKIKYNNKIANSFFSAPITAENKLLFITSDAKILAYN